MSVLLAQDMTAEDRATALVGWASRWDEFAGSLGTLPFFTTDRLITALTAACAPYANPMLDADTLFDLLRDLRDAVNARDTYQTYGFLPDHLDEKCDDGYTREWAEQALDEDINAALWPLLTGLSTAYLCRECRRVSSEVTYWNPTVRGTGRCERHQIVSTGPAALSVVR